MAYERMPAQEGDVTIPFASIRSLSEGYLTLALAPSFGIADILPDYWTMSVPQGLSTRNSHFPFDWRRKLLVERPPRCTTVPVGSMPFRFHRAQYCATSPARTSCCASMANVGFSAMNPSNAWRIPDVPVTTTPG